MTRREHPEQGRNFKAPGEASGFVARGGDHRELNGSDVVAESPGTLAEFSQLWDELRPYLNRRVTRILSEFGDVDDLVDDVLDAARARCARRASCRSVNRQFVYRTTTRVALSKRDLLRRRGQTLERRSSSVFVGDESREPMKKLEVLRRIDEVMMAADDKERRIIFEVLRQFRDKRGLSYKELGRALGCTEWKARATATRCFSKIRARLKLGRDGSPGAILDGPGPD